MKKIKQFTEILFFLVFSFNCLNCMQQNLAQAKANLHTALKTLNIPHISTPESNDADPNLNYIKHNVIYFYNNKYNVLNLSSHEIGFKLTNENLISLLPTILEFISDKTSIIIDLTNNNLKLDGFITIIEFLLFCNVKTIQLEGNPIHFSVWNKFLINLRAAPICIQNFLDAEYVEKDELVLDLGFHGTYKVQTKFKKIKPIIYKLVIFGGTAILTYCALDLLNSLL